MTDSMGYEDEIAGQLLVLLQQERRTVELLRTEMGFLRTAIEADDLEGLNGAVFGLRRLVASMQEGYRCRVVMGTRLGITIEQEHADGMSGARGAIEGSTTKLKQRLGASWNDEMELIHSELMSEAQGLWDDLQIQQQLLGRLVSEGRVMGERLRAAEHGRYAPAGEGGREGVIMDKKG